MFGILNLSTIFIISCAVFYYKAAGHENIPGILWAGLSLIVALGTILLGWGWLGLIGGQVGLFFIIAIVRVVLANRG